MKDEYSYLCKGTGAGLLLESWGEYSQWFHIGTSLFFLTHEN